MPFRSRFLIASLLLILPGCRQDKIEVYRIPKEQAAPIAAASTSAPEAAPAPPGDLSWTVPAGWKAMPGSAMRRATFAAGEAEVSVVVFPGDAGGTLANVNRWRGQLGLEAIDEPALGPAVSKVSSAGGELSLVDFDGAGGQRMVGAILPSGGRTWFFKMTGKGAAVESAKPAFLDFLRSLHD